jgi:hypothetical protein
LPDYYHRRVRIAVAADERTGVADMIVDELLRRGHEPIAHGEILDAWFAAEASDAGDDRANIEHLAEIEAPR